MRQNFGKKTALTPDKVIFSTASAGRGSRYTFDRLQGSRTRGKVQSTTRQVKLQRPPCGYSQGLRPPSRLGALCASNQFVAAILLRAGSFPNPAALNLASPAAVPTAGTSTFPNAQTSELKRDSCGPKYFADLDRLAITMSKTAHQRRTPHKSHPLITKSPILFLQHNHHVQIPGRVLP